MHPKIEFPGILAPIFDDLQQPLHHGLRRNFQRVADPDKEVDVATGIVIDASNFTEQPYLPELVERFNHYMAEVMQAPTAVDPLVIRLHKGAVNNCPEASVERFHIDIRRGEADIIAEDIEGLRRAIYWLQDEMLIRRSPILPLGLTTRSTTLGTRIIRCPVAPYRWLSGWELTDSNDYYPDAYLERLAHAGINGLWIPGLLRHLVASRVVPEMGPGEHRLDKLRSIVARAARFGIRIYLFCIEPRALPLGHPALSAHPQLAGVQTVLGHLLCGSEPLVREYIRDVMQQLFTEVPHLAGVINIFCGERPTTCYWREEDAGNCPRCSQHSQADVLAETLNAFVEGIRAAGSSAEFMAWSYFVTTQRDTAPITPLLKVLEKTNPDVIWLGNFEHGGVKESCGKQMAVHEYSLSCVGPSDDFQRMAEHASQTGHRMYAKLQVGTSYELSSVPYVPVPGIEFVKIQRARELGVTGSMLTWIPGGFPSPMLKAAGESAFEPEVSEQDFLHRLAAIEWGEAAANGVARAWRIFAEAWQRYPFDIQVIYWGPITRSPAYQLHLEREPNHAKPYNWGFTRKREPQPWEDDLSRWTGEFSPQQISEAFREMAAAWLEGIHTLQSARPLVDPDEIEVDRQLAVAQAIRLQFLSAANVYEFYDVRDTLLICDKSEHPKKLQRMYEVAVDDVELARQMKQLMEVEPRLGFESEIYAFSYSVSLLEEKILQVHEILPILERWQKHGIEREILERTVEEAEWLRPDRDPDRWGD